MLDGNTVVTNKIDDTDDTDVDDGQTTFTDEERDATADAFVEAMEADGYEVLEGFMYFFQKEDCLQLRHCYGNNPSSPYGLYALPRHEDEFADDEATINTPQGEFQLAHRLRSDEALVFFGRLPPSTDYFGLTHYLFDRAGTLGVRRDIFARKVVCRVRFSRCVSTFPRQI